MNRQRFAIILLLAALALTSTLAIGQQTFHPAWTNPAGEPWRDENGNCWRDPTRVTTEPVVACGDVAEASTPAVETLRTLYSEVLFGFDSAALGTPGESALDSVIGAISDDWAITRIRVNGYTDRMGSEAYNQALSMDRAQAVADYLKTMDALAGSEISAAGRGESNPKVTCSDALSREALIECLAPNRRTELVLTLKRQN